MEQFKGQTRLPRFAVPKSYDLYLKTDLKDCTFCGTVKIRLQVSEPTKFIVLNALELDVSGALFTSSIKQEYHPCEVVLDGDDEILVLIFGEEIGVGNGELEMKFSGKLNEQLKGFYRCNYDDGGEKKNMAVTQFQAVDARRCFPCWDEPALKATFKITVDVPAELTALSNMPVVDENVNGDIKTVAFEESPPMSTYLVALVVGLFDCIEDVSADGIKVRAYCALGQSAKCKYALSIAVKALDLYSKYFSMPYPLPKLDMVAVPEFSDGAMENYGLITYRENFLYGDAYRNFHILPKTLRFWVGYGKSYNAQSPASKKQTLVIVTMHEVAHHWFGNLVTMEWWTDLWLNEGFATWVSYLATESYFPEWKIWTQFQQQTARGLKIDALEGSHPIEVEIHHARSVAEIFDLVSYKKGSAVMRMLQVYSGDETIQKSLSLYMKRYAWRNAKTEQLWSVLSEVSGIQVNSIMDGWTKQQGYPIITVKAEDHFLVFEQSQFLTSGLKGNGKWIVPITFLIGPHNKKMNFLLDSESQRVDLTDVFRSSDESMWVKVNIEQSGFYRVKYEDKLAAQLRRAVDEGCLSATDQFGILDDTLALCSACEVPLSSLLALMNVYRKELDYVVLSKLIDVCDRVLEVCIDVVPSAVGKLKSFFISLLLPSAEKLGWEAVPGEGHLDALSRGEVYTALASLGHDLTHNEASRRFHAFLDDKDSSVIPADLKKATYTSVMRNASSKNRIGFESLLKFYKETDVLQEKEWILRCLASSPDPDIVTEVLDLLISDEVRDQDAIYGLFVMSLEGREAAWRWLKENWDRILNHYGPDGVIHNFIRDIISPLSSSEIADEAAEFFATRGSPSFATIAKQSIENVRVKARWAESIRQEDSLEEIINQIAAK